MSGTILMNVAVFLWGFTGVLGRAISLNEISLVFWRMVITVVSIALGTRLLQPMLRRRYPRVFLDPVGNTQRYKLFSSSSVQLMIPGMVLGMHWICFYGAIKYSNVSIALTCLGTAPLIAALLEPLFFRKKIQGAEIFLGLFVFSGILMIYYSHVRFSSGVIYGVLAALLTVVVSILNKKLVSTFSPARMISYQMLGALLSVSAVFPLYTLAFGTNFQLPTPVDVGYLFVLSWCCTILTFFLWMIALIEVSAFSSNVILSLEPVYGIVLAFLFYQEHLDVGRFFYVGFALIMFAVGLNVYRTTKR